MELFLNEKLNYKKLKSTVTISGGTNNTTINNNLTSNIIVDSSNSSDISGNGSNNEMMTTVVVSGKEEEEMNEEKKEREEEMKQKIFSGNIIEVPLDIKYKINNIKETNELVNNELSNKKRYSKATDDIIFYKFKKKYKK
ncbi:hypothetical protein ABK040_010726 [Willaertia magna]